MTTDPGIPSPALVRQRVRNRLIEYLELAASFDQQHTYQATAPIHVPDEIVNQWEDWYRPDLPSDYAPPLFSHEEALALQKFHAVWNEVALRTPDPLPPLDSLQQTDFWNHLRCAAESALKVFNGRGRFDEDVEVQF
jgi:hypothetical protein